MPDVDAELLVADAEARRAWLAKHHASSDGVWLVVGKKASNAPISVRLGQAKKPETRARRIEQFVAQLERGEAIHPQRRTIAEGEQA